MAFNATALNAYVKRTYDPKFIDNMMTSVEEKILRDIKKVTDGSGENHTWLCDADDSVSGSADFPIAQNAASANNDTVGSKFLSDWNDFSAVAQITSSIIGKTRNNDGAWQQAVDIAMRKRARGIAHINAVFMQGRGWGEVSQISSVSGSTFVPTVRSDITKYAKGMPLHFSASLHSNGLRSSTVVYVTAVNYNQGTELVTLSATLASVSAVNSDWCFVAGCRQDSGSPARIAICGLGGFLPDQSSGSADMSDSTITTAFLGADRSSNSRLYGMFNDATGGGSKLGALIDVCQDAITVGNATKLELYASKAVYAEIAKDLQSSVQYVDNPSNKTVGTKRLLIYSDGDAEAHLQVSRTTNDTVIWGFDPSQVELKSIGGAPHIDSEDGLTMARQASAAGYEVRWFQQAIFKVKNLPGCVRVKLA